MHFTIHNQFIFSTLPALQYIFYSLPIIYSYIMLLNTTKYIFLYYYSKYSKYFRKLTDLLPQHREILVYFRFIFAGRLFQTKKIS